MMTRNLFTAIFFLFVISSIFGCEQGSLSQFHQPSLLNDMQVKQEEKCSEIKSVRVTNKEFINKESKYREIKESIINQCKIDAVTQAIGAEIRANKKMNLDVANSDIDEKYSELNIEKTKGYIDSYEVIDERIVKMDDVSLLEITILTNVCIPSKKPMNEIVIIGDFISSDGKNDDNYRAVLKTCMDKYGLLQIASFTPGEDKYYDIIVRGRLIKVDITKGKSKTELEQSIASDLIGILSVNTGRELKRKSKMEVKKVRAIVGLEAMKRYDNESINAIGEKIIEIPSNLKSDVAETNAIHDAIDIASTKLIKKLLAK